MQKTPSIFLSMELKTYCARKLPLFRLKAQTRYFI